MSFSLTTHRIRCQSDYSEPGAVINRLTGKTIHIPIASDVRFEVGIFTHLNGGSPSTAAQVASETGWLSLTLSLQTVPGVNVVSKTVSSFSSLTFATWNDDTAQHCSIDLTDAETNIHPGRYRLALTVQSSTFGPYPVGTADVIVFEPHNLNSSDPADANPGAPMSRDQADAVFLEKPAGAVDTRIFFQNAGVMAQSTNLTYNPATDVLALGAATTLKVPFVMALDDGTLGVIGDVDEWTGGFFGSPTLGVIDATAAKYIDITNAVISEGWVQRNTFFQNTGVDTATMPHAEFQITHDYTVPMKSYIGPYQSDSDDLNYHFALSVNGSIGRTGVAHQGFEYDPSLPIGMLAYELNWATPNFGGGNDFVDIAADGITVTSSITADVQGRIVFSRYCKATDSVKLGSVVRPVLSVTGTPTIPGSNTLTLAVAYPGAPATVLFSYGLRTATGTATVPATNPGDITTVTGIGTKFTEEFMAGGSITLPTSTIGGACRQILSIESDTSLTLVRPNAVAASGQVYLPGIRNNEIWFGTVVNDSARRPFMNITHVLNPSVGTNYLYYPVQIERLSDSEDTSTPLLYAIGASSNAKGQDPVSMVLQNTHAGAGASGVTAGATLQLRNSGNETGSSGYDAWWYFALGLNSTGANSNSDSLAIYQYQTTGGLTLADRVAFYAKDGKVGIHTLSPATAFHVVGVTTLSNGTSAGELRFAEGSGGGTNYAAIKAPATLAADYTLTLPADDGTPNQFLQTNGSGVLSWASGVSPFVVKSANGYTAAAGDRIQADTTAGTLTTITLPASASVGDEIVIEDAALTWGAFNLTLARNGLKINSGTSDYTANVIGGKLSIVYISAGYGWSIK